MGRICPNPRSVVAGSHGVNVAPRVGVREKNGHSGILPEWQGKHFAFLFACISYLPCPE